MILAETVDMEEYVTSRRPKVKPAEVKKTNTDDYFIRVSIFHYVCVALGFLVFGFVCFYNDETAFEHLGGPGRRLLYLKQNYLTELRIGFVIAVLLHIIEAVYAIKLATVLQLNQETLKKWTLQTFLVGYSSLRHLIEYSRKQKEVGKIK